ncbi:NCL1 [Candida pseudojiufengensis]|uniref:NCL1 n=1 Tax=Candida pseudojiufengensis TaxID=497109 RepID=UPI00222596D3|nr:NCL1 [Candida pseudojiufengensis]KAI5962561.1 NCL1 [Candida pseudojiufengensis]
MLNRANLLRQNRTYIYKFNMPKRNFKRNNKKDTTFKRQNNENGANNTWKEVERDNADWEKYYKSMKILPESEWEEFKKSCQANLPMTFRITGNRKHAEEIRNVFLDRHVKNLKGKEFEGVDITPKNIEFYPNELGWQIDVSKQTIKKQKDFAKTQRFLVIETEVGNISRQEAVSMIPPLLMDIKPEHYVLDMCAAPGSKTAQLIEALHANDEKEQPTGFVLANDSDYKRSHMLVHQIKRLNSPNFLVVNHDAQLFPRIRLNNSSTHLKFDRILCDVPCSGDGTMRKNINIWKDFRPGNAIGLHPLQYNILNRGLQLLKSGGRLVYSTCSLSPIENEAIVAEALRQWGSKIKLVDVSNELSGLKRRQGMNDWVVFGKDMKIKQKGEDEILSDSMYPPTEEEIKSELRKCVRVYPHLQNTGGFFITVFEKVDQSNTSSVSNKRTDREDENIEKGNKKQKTSNTTNEKPESVVVTTAEDSTELKPTSVKQKLPRDANEEPFIFLDPSNEELQKCWPFYDFNENFPKDCTLVRNATGEPLRTIYYASPIVKEILTINDQKLKLVHGGIKLFVSQRSEHSEGCPWRVQTEALHTIEHFIGTKRHLKCNLKLLEYLFTNAFPKIEELRKLKIDEEFSNTLDTLSEGCLFLTISRDDKEDLFLPLWKGKTNINLMVSKKDTHELLSRIFDIDTTANDVGKEKLYQEKVEAAKKDREDKEASEDDKVTDKFEKEEEPKNE